jgi:hypothetical protein
VDSFVRKPHCEDHHRMRYAVTIITVLVLVGIVVMWVSTNEMYDKCGPCRQGLLQALKDRY